LRAAGLAARLAAAAPVGAGGPAGDPAVTVTGQGAGRPAMAAPVAEPPTQHLGALPVGAAARDRRPWPWPWWRALNARSGAAAAAVVVAIVAAVLLGSVIEPGPAPRAGTIPSAAPSGPAQPAHAKMVDIRLGVLIGQQVTAAAQRLRQQGLTVRVRWRHSGEQPQGTVLSVRPAGSRPVGSVVTLVAAITPDRAGDGDDGPAGHGPGGHGKDGPGPGGPKGGPGPGGDGPDGAKQHPGGELTLG